MIKICSLDFLNREIFETDIMTADGEVLFESGQKITPEVLLRLYFKEIYIAQPLAERERVVNKVSAAVLADVTNEAPLEVESKTSPAVENENISEVNSFVDSQDDLNEEETEKKKSKKDPQAVVNDTEEKDEIKKGPKAANLKFDSDEEDTDAKSAKNDENESKGPRLASGNLNLDDAKDSKSAGATEDSDEKEEKGPRLAEFNFETDNEEGEIIKGPRSIGSNKFDDEDEDGKTSSRVKNFSMGPEVEIPKVNPEELPLVFDEEQAQRIAQYSAKLGRMIGFSEAEVKELELVAYNCNIGVSKFKKADAAKKGFRKMKAYASYEKLIESGIIPAHLAEMVKYIVNSYESDSFPLDAKIPYYHIVAITSFYEDLLAQNKPKTEILLKMLQLGGHKFNIFVLHKFIKMMRDAND